MLEYVFKLMCVDLISGTRNLSLRIATVTLLGVNIFISTFFSRHLQIMKLPVTEIIIIIIIIIYHLHHHRLVQGICTYIPEKERVCREYSVAAIL
jgi:hypothetical protein